MTDQKAAYDWAAAALSVEQCDTTDLRQLVSAAKLDAENGDLSDVDLSDMDLRGQDLSGWDLRSACFQGARIADANLSGTKINLASLTEAEDWQKAKLDDDTMLAAVETAVRKIELSRLAMSVRAYTSLRKENILTVGQVMSHSASQLLRIPNFGRKSLTELKILMQDINVIFSDDPVSQIDMIESDPDEEQIKLHAETLRSCGA